MGLTAKQNGQLEKLKDDKIAEQDKKIELKNKLIENKDEELDVPSKLKSYSSVLRESCSAALEPRKIASAVRKVAEAEDHSKSLILFGVPEEQVENVDNKFNQLLEDTEGYDPNKHYIIRKGKVVFLSERTGCVNND